MVCAIISPAVRLMSLASLASVGAGRRNHSFAEFPPPAAPFSTELAPRCCKMASARFVFSTILKIQFSICRTIITVNYNVPVERNVLSEDHITKICILRFWIGVSRVGFCFLGCFLSPRPLGLKSKFANFDLNRPINAFSFSFGRN